MSKQPPAGATAANTQLWSLLRTTPLSDVLCGHLTGRLSVPLAIAAAELPADIAQLIQLVTRRTRLWRIEKVDVARELAEHFRDGLVAGQSTVNLLRSFGDPQQAARLIRRSKLRNRSLGWRILRRTKQAIAVTTVLAITTYLLLLGLLLTGRPVLSHNYAMEITAPARATLEADRAWPCYRSALVAITRFPRVKDDNSAAVDKTEGLAEFVDIEPSLVRPGDRHWKLVASWINDNQFAVQKIRQGAGRPQFGFIYADREDKLWLEKQSIRLESMDLNANPPLFMMPLPQYPDMRALARLTVADSRLAIEQRDGQRFVSDIEALMGMSQQMTHDLPLLIENLVGIAIASFTLETVEEIVADSSAAMSDEDLKRLAHIIACFHPDASLVAAIDGERLLCLDYLQRMFTDDGNGDGRITAEGLRLLNSLGTAYLSFYTQLGVKMGFPMTDRVKFLATGPAAIAMMATRRQTTEKAIDLYDRMSRQLARPMWQWKRPLIEDTMRNASLAVRMRFAPLEVLAPATTAIAQTGERACQERDVALVALALELYHRRHTVWPVALAALVPDLLPEVPPDRYTGNPLGYRLHDGRPLVYSVGPDQQDNSGSPMLDRNADLFYVLPANISDNSALVPVGDFILWPRPVNAETEGEPASIGDVSKPGPTAEPAEAPPAGEAASPQP